MHDEIALAAYLAWEKEGRQSGRETAHWIAAEAQVRELHRQHAAAAAKPWPPVATARGIKPVAKVHPTAIATKSRATAAPRVTKPAVRRTSVKTSGSSRIASARRAA
ncbi:MAG: DUF2934 domain-containing protein [Verrucomicrobia bacterium]|nr:DUF2934 domain-containing protein [Verrucomicrobiota bacterium]